MNHIEARHLRFQVVDHRHMKHVKEKDLKWRGNSPSTLRAVNKIINKQVVDHQQKIDHGLDWNIFSEFKSNLPHSLNVEKGEDGMTAKYTNLEKKLEPGVRDSPPIFFNALYQQGVHLLRFNFEFVSPILHSSHYNVYIGVGGHRRGEKTTQRNTICKWWLSLTKIMLVMHETFLEPYPDSATMEMPQNLYMVLDMDEGTLGFIVNDCYLGPAHGDLCGSNVCPLISYYGNVDCNIKVEYIGSLYNPPSLKKICRKFVRQLVTKDGVSKGNLGFLNLPESVEQYVDKDLNSI